MLFRIQIFNIKENIYKYKIKEVKKLFFFKCYLEILVEI